MRLPTPQRPTTGRGLGRAGPRPTDDDRVLTEPRTIEATPKLPRIPASPHALIFDKARQLLILNHAHGRGGRFPVARSTQMVSRHGTPAGARPASTAASSSSTVDSRASTSCGGTNRPGGVRFLFDRGTLTDRQLAATRLQHAEIQEHRFADPGEALAATRDTAAPRVRCRRYHDTVPVPQRRSCRRRRGALATQRSEEGIQTMGRRQDDASASPLERYGYRNLGWIAQNYAPFWLAELILLWRNRRVFFTALQRIMSEDDYAVYPPASSDHFRREARLDEIEWFPARWRDSGARR